MLLLGYKKKSKEKETTSFTAFQIVFSEDTWATFIQCLEKHLIFQDFVVAATNYSTVSGYIDWNKVEHKCWVWTNKALKKRVVYLHLAFFTLMPWNLVQPTVFTITSFVIRNKLCMVSEKHENFCLYFAASHVVEVQQTWGKMSSD